MKTKFLIFFLILTSFSGGCTVAAPAQTVGLSPTAAAEKALPQPVTATETMLPSATQPPPPTATVAPSSTPKPAPTETALPSPTATELPMAEFRFTGSVRQMPDTNAAVIASFSPGIRLQALHQDPTGHWYYVKIAPFNYGWVFQDEVTGTGLDALAQATPDVTPTPEAQASGGKKCFLTVTYTDKGKPNQFQIFMQGLNPSDNYTYKIFNPKGGLMTALEIKARADGTFYRESSADKASPGTYTMEIYFASQLVTTCSGSVVQK